MKCFAHVLGVVAVGALPAVADEERRVELGAFFANAQVV